jgi:uncharacterized protein with PIN domain
VEPFWVRLRFEGDLSYFLKHAGDKGEIQRELKEPTSVKDVIESCGVPHVEVDRILVDQTPAEFKYVLRKNSSISVYPVGFSKRPEGEAGLQHQHVDRFVADGHLGKLTRNLRLLGFDVAYDQQLQDPQLLEIMQREQRALLTRDRRLLMHAIVVDGYCPRSSEPMAQTAEVVRRFHLENEVKPFTRCLHCNAPLVQVDKSTVLDQLEPLTRLYYNEFRRCNGCGKIFWRGSHFAKLESFLAALKTSLQTET